MENNALVERHSPPPVLLCELHEGKGPVCLSLEQSVHMLSTELADTCWDKQMNEYSINMKFVPTKLEKEYIPHGSVTWHLRSFCML